MEIESGAKANEVAVYLNYSNSSCFQVPHISSSSARLLHSLNHRLQLPLFHVNFAEEVFHHFGSDPWQSQILRHTSKQELLAQVGLDWSPMFVKYCWLQFKGCSKKRTDRTDYLMCLV